MRLLTPITLLTLTPILATPHPNNASTPLSLHMATSIISRHDGLYTPSSDSSGPLQAGIVQKTFSHAIAQYPTHPSTAALSTHITQTADALLGIFANASSALRFSLDRLSTAHAFLDLYARTGREGYSNAAGALRESVGLNARNGEGGLWYFVYPDWSYLDGMFSFGPFWAEWTAVYAAGDVEAWGELRRQFGLLARHCEAGGARGEGLLVHGYDGSGTAVWANNSLGQSPHVWGRSLGWYVWGLLETVEVLDVHGGWANGSEVQAIRDEFVEEFQSRMEAIVRAVDPATGGWWQVMDAPGREGNYIESSGSSMFVYALLAGVRKGYLDPTSPSSNASLIDIGRRAYEYLKDTFVVENGNGTLGWNGTVSVCSLNSTASYDYYTSRPILYNSVLGSAAFVAASLEVERLDDCAS